MSSNSSPPVTLGGEGREEWKKEEKEEERGRGGEREKLLAYTNKPQSHAWIKCHCVCVCVQNILTGQRLGNESLPLKCCHGVSLQKRGGHIKGRSQVKGIRTCNFFVFDC